MTPRKMSLTSDEIAALVALAAGLDADRYVNEEVKSVIHKAKAMYDNNVTTIRIIR